MQGALRARTTARNDQIRAAYLTAVLPGMKRPPKLADLLTSEKAAAPRRRKTTAELFSISMAWHHRLNPTAPPLKPGRPVSPGAPNSKEGHHG